MRHPKLNPWLSEQELLDWVRSAATRAEHDHRLAVWLTYLRYPAATVARLLGVSTPSVWRWVGAYNRQGPAALKLGAWGGRRWGFMSLEQERDLLASCEPESAAGKVLTAKQLYRRVCQAVGRKVTLAYVYGLLKRHRWRKLAPRPTHVKADPAAREAFKKGRRNRSNKL
jgi:transposase